MRERRHCHSPGTGWIAAALFMALVLTAPTGAAVAGYEEGLAAAKGDFATALREWRPLAEHGDPRAQHDLGDLYRSGLGVPQDLAEAARWYQRAADGGFARAMINLGVMYERGIGVEADAAQAAAWYLKAAERGNVHGQLNIGRMHALGMGVPQDDKAAYIWFTLAAAQGSKDGATYRALAAENLTPEQLAAAKKEAREMKRKLAK